jgi:hypothetical protein
MKQRDNNNNGEKKERGTERRHLDPMKSDIFISSPTNHPHVENGKLAYGRVSKNIGTLN